MDALLECHICTKPFSSDVCVPRMLPCGHTMCTTCMSKMIRSKKPCPDCRQSIPGKSASNFPINFIALQANEPSTESRIKDDLLSEVTTLLDGCSKVEEKLNSLQIDCGKQLKDLHESKQKLNGMVTRWECQTAKEVSRTRDILRNQIRDICKSFPGVFPFELLQAYSFDSFTFKSSDFENGNLFLAKIYKNVSAGINIVAVLKSEEGIKYAKLSAWKNRLKVHSFDSFESAKTTSLANGTKTVCFRDLKECMEGSGKLTVFFTLSLFGKVFPFHVFLKLVETPFKKYFMQGCIREIDTVSFIGTEVSTQRCISPIHLKPKFTFNIDVTFQSLLKFCTKQFLLQEIEYKIDIKKETDYLMIRKGNDGNLLFSYGQIPSRLFLDFYAHPVGICDFEVVEECNASRYGTSKSDRKEIIDCGLSVAF